MLELFGSRVVIGEEVLGGVRVVLRSRILV